MTITFLCEIYTDKSFIGNLSQFVLSFHVETMNFLSGKKVKPFSLKSIENSNLFQRRVSNTTCLIDNNEISRHLLINYNSKNSADKHDKTTNTAVHKNADNSTNFTKFIEINEVGRNSMENQSGKTLKIETNNGSV